MPDGRPFLTRPAAGWQRHHRRQAERPLVGLRSGRRAAGLPGARCRDALEELGKYPDAGGAGTEAEKFAQAYKKIGNRWLEVWGRSVLSVGGVAVGFTETANAYTRADVAGHPKPGKTAEQRPRPAVIDRPRTSTRYPTSSGATTTAATTSCAA
ncbi:hypothetical protein NKH18_38290 [Streptomyces sp. M10(2022)]